MSHKSPQLITAGVLVIMNKFLLSVRQSKNVTQLNSVRVVTRNQTKTRAGTAP